MPLNEECRKVQASDLSATRDTMFDKFLMPKFLKHLEGSDTARLVRTASMVNANSIAEIDSALVHADFDERIFYVWVASMQILIREINEIPTADKWKLAARHLLARQMSELYPDAIKATLHCARYIETKAKPNKTIDLPDLHQALGEWIIWRLDFDKTNVRPDTAERIGFFIEKYYSGTIRRYNAPE